MLLELSVARIALIESVHLQFKDGLHVFTGETGAGKSILLDAIGLLLGNRWSADWIRTGENDAYVEALFNVRSRSHKIKTLLSEWGFFVESDEILLTRQLYRNGRTVCRINGRMATVQMFRELGICLVQQHGQHDHQGLLRPEEQMRMLDLYGHLGALIEEVARSYQTWKEAYHNCEKATVSEQERIRRIDVLKFQIEEIESVDITEDEDEKIRSERQKLQHADKISAALESARAALEGGDHSFGAAGMIAVAMSEISAALHHDEGLQEISSLLQNADVYVGEALREIQQHALHVEADPEKLNRVENRMVEIRTLTRKYGPSISDVLHHLENAKSELYHLERHAEHVAALEDALKQKSEHLKKVSLKLHKARAEVACALSEEVEKVLRELNMPSAKFAIEVDVPDTGYEKYFSARGIDAVRFLFTANKGEQLKPLQKVASGGELSRTLLAIKSVLAEVDDLDTLIFDEIDTGVSGDAALAIARQLLKIGSTRQVLCVTHSAQIAAAGEHHYRIEKSEMREKTTTSVTYLGDSDRVSEVSRLIGRGASDETAHSHAVALLATFRDRASIRQYR